MYFLKNILNFKLNTPIYMNKSINSKGRLHMSLTISNQAQYLYNNYTYTNSDNYKKSAVDSSSVSKDTYDAADLTSALNAVDKTDSANLDSISDINTYVQNVYTSSQLDSSETPSDPSSSDITRLISGTAGSDDIYSLIQYGNFLETEQAKSLAGSSTSKVSAYNTYLNQSGNIIDKVI